MTLREVAEESARWEEEFTARVEAALKSGGPEAATDVVRQWSLAMSFYANTFNPALMLRLLDAGSRMRERGHANDCRWVRGGPKAHIQDCDCGANAWDAILHPPPPPPPKRAEPTYLDQGI